MEPVVDVCYIKDYLLSKNISYREMARRMGVNSTTVVRILAGERNPGTKFLAALHKDGCDMNRVFQNPKQNREDIKENICNYFNTMVMIIDNREFNTKDIDHIKKAMYLEKNDRQRSLSKINGNSGIGRKIINKRIAEITNKLYKLDISYKHIEIFKRSCRLERIERNLIEEKGV